jgi:hypothetical protein
MLCANLAAQPTWRGQISDSRCGPEHTMTGMTSRACADACVKSKATYAFVWGGKTYQIAGQTDRSLATHAGQTVVLTGTLHGDTVTVSHIAKANKK